MKMTHLERGIENITLNRVVDDIVQFVIPLRRPVGTCPSEPISKFGMEIPLMGKRESLIRDILQVYTGYPNHPHNGNDESVMDKTLFPIPAVVSCPGMGKTRLCVELAKSGKTQQAW